MPCTQQCQRSPNRAGATGKEHSKKQTAAWSPLRPPPTHCGDPGAHRPQAPGQLETRSQELLPHWHLVRLGAPRPAPRQRGPPPPPPQAAQLYPRSAACSRCKNWGRLWIIHGSFVLSVTQNHKGLPFSLVSRPFQPLHSAYEFLQPLPVTDRGHAWARVAAIPHPLAQQLWQLLGPWPSRLHHPTASTGTATATWSSASSHLCVWLTGKGLCYFRPRVSHGDVSPNCTPSARPPR